jgi:hypothetical protein
MRTLILIGTVLLCLASESVANGYLGTQCIRLTPESRGFDSTLAVPPVDQAQAGTAAYCLARVEGAEDRGDAFVDADVKRVFIFQNTDGVYVVRILDLPPGLGLRGRF